MRGKKAQKIGLSNARQNRTLGAILRNMFMPYRKGKASGTPKKSK